MMRRVCTTALAGASVPTTSSATTNAVRHNAIPTAKDKVRQYQEAQEWRRKKDSVSEAELRAIYDSDPKKPKTIQYNTVSGYGVRRRLRVPRPDKDTVRESEAMAASALSMLK